MVYVEVVVVFKKEVNVFDAIAEKIVEDLNKHKVIAVNFAYEQIVGKDSLKINVTL